MPVLLTDAIVLHVADYLESSRILRLATRDAGIQSVVARGARNSRKRFGHALDLFAIGQAHIDVRGGRDLQTLTGFEVVRSQPQLALDLARFSAASAIAESTLRVVHEEAAPTLFDGLLSAFAALGEAEGDAVIPTALGALWRIVREVGVAPALDVCAECHAVIAPDAEVVFSHQAGGALCDRCRARSPGARRLPPSARAAIRDWLEDRPVELSRNECRAHQRLLREFLAQHLTDGRPLRAFLDWEAGTFESPTGYTRP